MNTLPASHYLEIYTGRVGRAEELNKQLEPGVLEGGKRLIAALRNLDPSEAIRLEISSGCGVFTKASTGEHLVTIPAV